MLERHVTSLQVIHPKVQHSLFKGEPVYRRANVHTVKAEAGWLREGREVMHGQEPMKWGKVRAMTKQRQRELEAEKERTGEEVRQPLYSQAQTRLVRPPRIKNVSCRPRSGLQRTILELTPSFEMNRATSPAPSTATWTSLCRPCCRPEPFT